MIARRLAVLALPKYHVNRTTIHSMTTVIAEVYDAFKSAGAEEDKALAAASAIADYQAERPLELASAAICGEHPVKGLRDGGIMRR